MLRNPDGARLFEHLDRLFSHGIRIHGQVVLTPGVNDGDVLRETIERTASLYSAGCLSLAVVPVGLTDHRSRLPALRSVRPDEAAEVVELCSSYQRRFLQELGSRFVFPADELFLLAGLPLPPLSEYEDLAQVENGVGLCARLDHEWRRARADMNPPAIPRRLVLATGALAAPLLEAIAAEMCAAPGVRARVAPIRNDFFGPSVTVSGLLTGQDLAAQLRPLQPDEEVLVPACSLRDGYFLDDWSLERLAAELGAPVIPVAPRGEALALAAGFTRRRRLVRVGSAAASR
jgi:NifB/MoaA-like Fe-S oxidoreductase